MLHIGRLSLAALTLCVLLTAGAEAGADTFTFNAGYIGTGYVTNFSLPAGQEVIGAVVSGRSNASFDHCCFPGNFPLPVWYYIDGTKVVVGEIPSPGGVGLNNFSYVFAPSELANFNDGSFIVTGCANNNLFCSSTGGLNLLITATLTLTTAPQGQTPVPEPTTLLLFGAGLAGISAAARRRRRRAGHDS